MAPAATAAPDEVRSPWNCGSNPGTTDDQLLQQFLSGTGETAGAAFAALVERYGPIVHRVCRDVLGSSHEAQDAAQAVFLVLARKARSIRKPEALGPWLHGVAFRVARRARTEAARRRAAERKRAEIMRERATDAGPGPMEFAELHDEIDRLPEKYRQPIILCYMQGQTQPQAAKTLGWPLGTVQVRLHRGRERLRSRLIRRGAGFIPLTGAGFITSLSTPPASALEHGWTKATARAAVRFAARKGTAGLVALPVTDLADSILATMLLDTLKAVALAAVALVLISEAVKKSW